MTPRILAPLALAALAGTGAAAQTIIDDWANAKPPPPPALRSVVADPKTTALLLLDFNGRDTSTSGPCNAENKPRCIASVPLVRGLLEKARAKGVVVVYSLSANGHAGDIRPALVPARGERVVSSGPDKFLHTTLGDLLVEKSIKTVIVTGTAAEGAVLDTATDAALRGMTVILPVDGVSSSELYAEQYVAWHMTHAPGVAQRTILTRIDMIGF